MKKGLKVLALGAFILLLTTGCYDYKVEMGINDDKSVDFSMATSIDMTSLVKEYELEEEDLNFKDYTGIDDESISSLKKRGFEVKETTEGYKYGIEITKKYENIDDISTDKDVKVDLDKIIDDKFKEVFFKSENGTTKSTYTGHFIFDLSDSEDTEDFDLSEYKDQINFQYVVKLGSKVKCNEKATNAKKISDDGKELTWELELGKKNEIIYEFEIPSSGGVIAIVVCIVLLVALGGIGVFLLKKTGKQDNIKIKEKVAE